MPDVQNINLSKIIKRLGLIESLISLEEEDEIDAHKLKLEQLEYFLFLRNKIIPYSKRGHFNIKNILINLLHIKLPTIFIFVLSITSISSCVENNELISRDEYDNMNGYTEQIIGQKAYFEKIKSYINNNKRNDTAFLGFRFNDSKKQNDALIKDKIKDGLITDWKVDSGFIYLGQGRNFRQVKVGRKGYFYDFFMPNENHIKGVINFHYDNDSLTALRYQIYYYTLPDFRESLESKLGLPNIDTSFSTNESNYTLKCWLNNSREIQLVSGISEDWLQYNSIKKVFERESSYFDQISYKRKVDSMRIEEGRKRKLEIKKQEDTILNIF